MTRGGSREGAGRRSLTESEKRKQLSCRVKTETLEWLSNERERVNRSMGELVDLAVEVLQMHPEELLLDGEAEEQD